MPVRTTPAGRGPARRQVRTMALVLGGAALIGVSGLGVAADRTRDVERMTVAAQAFLAALDDDTRAEATFALDATERRRWHFVPSEMHPRHGAVLGDLADDQRERAHDLLKAALSQRGYMTATQVMELEDVLLALEGGRRFARDRDEYYIAVFGEPASGEGWGWRFEGHHISLNFTVLDGDLAVSAPAFVGANPAEVRDGPQRGRRVLGDREDAARELLDALDDQQRSTATIATEAPRDILTGSDTEIAPLEDAGVRYEDLDRRQRGLLMGLITTYASMMAEDVAAYRLARVRAGGLDEVRFAWAGSHERGEPHYYRVQGPTFLIEYDNTQNDANHIHSVWRDFDEEFGAHDPLREHLREHVH